MSTRCNINKCCGSLEGTTIKTIFKCSSCWCSTLQLFLLEQHMLVELLQMLLVQQVQSVLHLQLQLLELIYKLGSAVFLTVILCAPGATPVNVVEAWKAPPSRLYSNAAPVGAVTTIVPVGTAHVGCTVTVAVGAAGGSWYCIYCYCCRMLRYRLDQLYFLQ